MPFYQVPALFSILRPDHVLHCISTDSATSEDHNSFYFGIVVPLRVKIQDEE